MRRRLTDRFVQKVAVDRRTEFRDTVRSGLVLQVTPKGAKSWGIRYRAAGRQRRLKLGSYPELSLAAARKAASDTLTQVNLGDDPQEEKIVRRAEELTFGELAASYLERWAKPNKITWWRDEQYLANDVLPFWRHRPARELRRRDLYELLDRIVARGAPVQANRVRGVISSLFSWAADRELVEFNIVLGTRRPVREKPREVVLAESEIRAVWQALEADGNVTSRALMVIFLTLLRRREALWGRWGEIDGPWWLVPAERDVPVAAGERSGGGMKGRTGERRSHLTYLTPWALEILEPLRRGDSEWMFESVRRRGRPVASLSPALRRIKTLSGVESFGPHVLRKTGATWLGELGFSDEVIGAVLAHRKTTVTGRHYNLHRYRQEKADALTAWSDRLREIVGKRA